MTYQPVVEGGSCRRVVIVRNRRGVHVGCQDDPIGVRLPEEGVEEAFVFVVRGFVDVGAGADKEQCIPPAIHHRKNQVKHINQPIQRL